MMALSSPQATNCVKSQSFSQDTRYAFMLWTARQKRTCGSYGVIACDAGYEAITNTRRVKNETDTGIALAGFTSVT